MRCAPRLAATSPDVDKAVSEGNPRYDPSQRLLIGAEGVEFADYLPQDVQLITVYAGAVCANATAPQTAATFIRYLVGPIESERLRMSPRRLMTRAESTSASIYSSSNSSSTSAPAPARWGAVLR
jgi:hypothetical protein